MLKIVYVAETDAQAQAELEEPMTNYLKAAYLANAADRLEAVIATEENHSAGMAASVAPERRAEFLDRALIAGSPDTVAARIQELADAGVTQLMLWMTWGYNDPERVRRAFRLFTDEVMPRFGAAAAIPIAG